MARARVAPPSTLDTWFVFVGDENPTLPHNSVSVIDRNTGVMTYGPASDHDWPNVYAWSFGNQT